MVSFSYWKAENSVAVEGGNDESLDIEEAKLIALIKATEELQSISSTLKDILYFMQHNEFQVHRTN